MREKATPFLQKSGAKGNPSKRKRDRQGDGQAQSHDKVARQSVVGNRSPA
jgi:hypothetical protein